MELKMSPIAKAAIIISGMCFVGSRMCKACSPPPVPPAHKVGEVVVRDDGKYEIIGSTGHGADVIELFHKTPHLVEKPVYFATDPSVAHRYAKMNSSNTSKAKVAFLGRKKGCHIPLDAQRFEGPFAPICSEAIRDGRVIVVAVQDSDENTDPNFSAALQRMLKQDRIARAAGFSPRALLKDVSSPSPEATLLLFPD